MRRARIVGHDGPAEREDACERWKVGADGLQNAGAAAKRGNNVRRCISVGGAADEALGAFGPIGFYVGGTSEVRFRDVSYKDLSLKEAVPEKLSPNFRMTQLTPFYYSFASAAADFNRDGNMDVASGPFIWMGPDFAKKRE